MATHQPPHRHSHGNGHRDTRDLEYDIQRTRSEMDETIHELSERLSPRRLMDDAYEYFRDSTGMSKREVADHAKTFGKSALRSIKQHPIPSLLIGAGLLYMLFEDDEEDRNFNAQWDDIPEYSGSFVDARTGEPYDLETYGAEFRRPAWRQGYDWSKSDLTEESWTQRAQETLAGIKSTLADSTKSARDKMRHVSTGVLGLSGHKDREMRSQWAKLRSFGGEPINEPVAREWETLMACDYYASGDWSHEEESQWDEKAQSTLEKIKQSLSDSGRSVQEQVQSITSSIGEMVGSSRDASAGFARSMYDRAGEAGESIRQGAGSASRGVSRGARFVGRKTRSGGRAAGRQLQQGYNYSRDAITEAVDDYPLAAGAAFLGLGLLLGFAIPETRYEDEMMGEASDELKHRAKETGREAVQRAQEVATATAAAALDEAEQQGVAPHQLGEKVQQFASDLKDKVSGVEVGEAGSKVSQVAHRAAETAKEATKRHAGEITSQNRNG